MLLSMTGFGRATCELPDKKITVEIKSLNSKQFDLNTRISPVYRGIEVELRNLVAQKLERGKVDLTVSVESRGLHTSAKLNAEVIKAYRRQVIDTCALTGMDEPTDWWALMMRFPDVLVAESDTDVNEDETKAVMDTVSRAADALMDYRRAEGKKLEAFFAVRIKNITDLLSQVPKFEAERLDRIRERLKDGLSKIPAVEYDKGRLEQEMIFYIEKLDVNEERQRLAQHLEYFTDTMNLPVPGQGKKLGFIAQEMGREINTLGSKSNHADMQKIVVMMKDNLEQIKEQVLNVM